MPNLQLFVTTNTSLDTGTASYTDPDQVADGAFAVLDAEDASSGSEDLTGTSAPDKLMLVRGGDSPQIEFIEKKRIESIQTQAFRAEVNQISAVGFDGAGNGTGISSDAGEATIRVTRKEAGYEPFPRTSAATRVKDADKPYDVAAALVEQFRKVKTDKIFGSDSKRFVTADVLSDEASTELQDDTTNAAVTLDVVNGSKTVTANVTSGEDIDTLSSGEQIRIGSTTDKSSPVYVAETIETNGGAQTELEVTLDRPYIGDTATGVDAGIVTAGAPADDDVIGVKITALDSEDGEPAISFETAVDGTLEDDDVLSVTTPVTAAGSTAQLKNVEEFSWGTRGFYYTNYFPKTPDSNVVDGTNYDMLTIIYDHDNDDGVVASNKYREIHIAYPEGNITLATLEAFFNS